MTGNKAKNLGQAHVYYNKKTREGQVVETLKETESNFSNLVRNYLFLIKGYEVLQETDISSTELKKLCLQAVQFHTGCLEIARIHLENCQSHCDRPQKTKVSNKNNTEEKSKTQTQVKDDYSKLRQVTLIDSLLPK
ncbi:hypothetical protein [Myxosarcina sp. GI1]|uniref:hypothetical protein n=1 Tax=Myxosarcina sp. GI1 TaxID=1541065 RepID=UPI00056A86C3|nr:hypothetical protein [Myxosarcina sp. GI1]